MANCDEIIELRREVAFYQNKSEILQQELLETQEALQFVRKSNLGSDIYLNGWKVSGKENV